MTNPAILLRAGQEPEVVAELPCELRPIYEKLNCSCLEIVRVRPEALEELERRFLVRLGRRSMIRLVVDEEGLLKGLPLNLNATFIARQLIVGDALLMEVE